MDIGAQIYMFGAIERRIRDDEHVGDNCSGMRNFLVRNVVGRMVGLKEDLVAHLSSRIRAIGC